MNQLQEISEFAFTSTKLKSFTGPETLSELGTYAFHIMSHISYIDLSKTKISVIRSNAFCSAFAKKIILPTTISMIETSGFNNAYYVSMLVFYTEFKESGSFGYCGNLETIYYFGKYDFSSLDLSGAKNIKNIYVTNDYKYETFGGIKVNRNWYPVNCITHNIKSSVLTKFEILRSLSILLLSRLD